MGALIRGVLSCGLAVVLWACGGKRSDDGELEPVPGLHELGEHCDPSLSIHCDERKDLFCSPDFRVCTQRCSSDADCGDMHCVSYEGRQQCIPACSGENWFRTKYACVDGRVTACTDVEPDSQCRNCGCSGDLRCVQGACVPKAALNEPCEMDWDCQSNNCSRFAKVCRVQVGGACDQTNCDRCMRFRDWSYCSRECQFTLTKCDGRGSCLGNQEDGYYCYAGCGLSATANTCPEACSSIKDSPGQYCACKTCERMEPLRAQGQRCELDTQCAGTTCLATTDQCGTSGAPCGYEGTCSKRCSTSAECEGGALCARSFCELPCNSAADCDRVDCVAMLTDQGMAQVCDGRGENGRLCRRFDDCRAGTCSAGICRGPAAIGDACAANPDCAQGWCCSGVCRSACMVP